MQSYRTTSLRDAPSAYSDLVCCPACGSPMNIWDRSNRTWVCPIALRELTRDSRGYPAIAPWSKHVEGPRQWAYEQVAQATQAGYNPEYTDRVFRRRCSGCKRELPVTSFALNRSRALGLGVECKDCQRINTRNQKRREATGADPALAGRLVELQGAVCAICGLPEATTNKRYGRERVLALDHDHTSGEIRGLICSSCHAKLVHLGHDSEWVRKALDYITDPPARRLFDKPKQADAS